MFHISILRSHDQQSQAQPGESPEPATEETPVESAAEAPQEPISEPAPEATSPMELRAQAAAAETPIETSTADVPPATAETTALAPDAGTAPSLDDAKQALGVLQGYVAAQEGAQPPS